MSSNGNSGCRRRIRSVSLSSDTECAKLGDMGEEFPFLVSTMSKTNTAPMQSSACFSRARSTNCIDNCVCGTNLMTVEKLSTCMVFRGVRFNQLPDECRLKVFSFLNILDRGFAAQVCVF